MSPDRVRQSMETLLESFYKALDERHQAGLGNDQEMDYLLCALEELEELRQLTRCKYFALGLESGITYMPCSLRADHKGYCK